MAGPRHDVTVFAAGIVISLALHAAAYYVLALVGDVRSAFGTGPSAVEVAIEDRPERPEPAAEPPPQNEPDAPEAPTPKQKTEPQRRERARRPSEPQRQTPDRPEPAPKEQTPVRFDGVMEASPDGTWSVPASSGEDRQGPLAAPGRDTGPRREGRSDGAEGGQGEGPAHAGPRVVALGDLSRPPGQPANLSDYLEREYPERAKAQGVEGTAKVRVRINPDGGLGPMRVVSESVQGYGLGDACRRTLRKGGRWTAPVDEHGRPAAVWITFPCQFRVRR